jgi:hypothetical protein
MVRKIDTAKPLRNPPERLARAARSTAAAISYGDAQPICRNPAQTLCRVLVAGGCVRFVDE